MSQAWRDWEYEEMELEDLRSAYGTILDTLKDTDDNLKSLKEDLATLKAAAREFLEAVEQHEWPLAPSFVAEKDALAALVGEE
jgi:hypothetical protein